MTSSSVAILHPAPAEGGSETHVVFPGGAVADFVDAGLVTLLQERVRALETELARQRDLEATLRAAEDDLRRQNEELARAVHFSETFIGMLGHDLRNPLSAITTGARLLMRRAESERVELPARRILSSGERMGRMIDQLLDFTRIRLHGGIPLERQLVDLGVICRTATDEIEGTYGADGIDIETVGDPVGLWDGDRLTQLVSNLLGNAVAHGSKGGRVRVRVDGGAATVVLTLHNRGAVPRDLLPHLFRPMGIGSDRKHTGSSGLGLGLYISQQIVLAHAGTIDVTSSEQDGTEVTVRLPRSTEPALRGAL
jgi:signal transduction histidine kinase